ncbi:hypothetical protein GCM10009786_18970 [Leucobacter alluvii]|uniref:MarR family transcriptional regulator n=1 Tax=Leucobacter alluvii TaxID=340321 RepID=A0ABP5MXX6_9MICO
MSDQLSNHTLQSCSIRWCALLNAITVQRQTSAALSDDLLEQIPDPAGGIARRFAVTEHGATRLDEVRDRSIRALDRILADWNDEDVNRFAELLHRFNADIESYSSSRGQ